MNLLEASNLAIALVGLFLAFKVRQLHKRNTITAEGQFRLSLLARRATVFHALIKLLRQDGDWWEKGRINAAAVYRHVHEFKEAASERSFLFNESENQFMQGALDQIAELVAIQECVKDEGALTDAQRERSTAIRTWLSLHAIDDAERAMAGSMHVGDLGRLSPSPLR
ncbi:MAG: hypothetical protein AB7O97_17710 [Planctomycetota bacterium]